MAKIKFNLNFGGEQIRTLDDLRDKFSIEDVLDVYSNGLLVKWLDVHNHKQELEKVRAIQTTDARGILSELIRIFGISDDPEEIQDSLSVLDYLEERKKVHEDMKAHGIPDYEKVKKERDELLKQNEELREMRDSITPEIEAPASTTQAEAPKPAKKSYEALVQEIIDNHQDLNHIYDCLDAITTDYPDIIKEKYSELFNRLYESRPHTIISLFAHHSTRTYYTLDEEKLGSAVAGVYIKYNVEVANGKIETFDIFYSRDARFEDNDSQWPAELREKVNFLKMLNSLARSIVKGNAEECLYIHIAKKSIVSSAWTMIETPERKFMPFYEPSINEWFFIGGMNNNSEHFAVRSRHLPFLLPIFEGLDAKTYEDSRPLDITVAYIEAR